MPRTGLEDYPPYELYLDQSTQWPRIGSDDMLEFKLISDMPVQHAASSLRKLLRWAENYIAGPKLNIYEPLDRQRFVRQTPLGKALAARATDQEFEDTVKDVLTVPVDERELVLLLVERLSEPPNDKTPNLVEEIGLIPATRVAMSIAGLLHERFTIEERADAQR